MRGRYIESVSAPPVRHRNSGVGRLAFLRDSYSISNSPFWCRVANPGLHSAALGGGAAASPPSMLTPPNRPHALLGGVHNSTSSASAPRRKGGYSLPGGPPNILMVLSDDHGYTDIGPDIDSNVVTPVLTALRKNGMHFANGYATAAQCVPSRAGLLSGRNQSTYLTLTLPLTLALALTLTLTLTLALTQP